MPPGIACFSGDMTIPGKSRSRSTAQRSKAFVVRRIDTRFDEGHGPVWLFEASLAAVQTDQGCLSCTE
jgi:hypothetical protein